MSTINLLPKDYVESRIRRRANVMCLILFAIVLSAVLAAAVVSEQSSRHTQAVRDRIDASYADAAKFLAQMQTLEIQRSQMLHKAEVTTSLVERVPRSTLLAVVTAALPSTCSLEKVTLDTQRVIVREEPAAPAGKGTKLTTDSRQTAKNQSTQVVMEVTGRAFTDVDVARFIANLLRCPLMTSVDLVYSEEKTFDKTAVRQFQVRLELKPNADAIDAIPGAAAAAAHELDQQPAGRKT